MAKKKVTAYSQKIAELVGTMPENLPTPEKSAKALKKERLKGVTKKSLVYLFFFEFGFVLGFVHLSSAISLLHNYSFFLSIAK